MHRIGIISGAVVAAAAAAMLVAPAASAATAAPATTVALATCTTGTLEATSGADVYSGPDSFRVLTTVVAGQKGPCLPGIALGRRYTACGESDGNGWVQLVLNTGQIGYSPQACFIDF